MVCVSNSYRMEHMEHGYSDKIPSPENEREDDEYKG